MGYIPLLMDSAVVVRRWKCFSNQPEDASWQLSQLTPSGAKSRAFISRVGARAWQPRHCGSWSGGEVRCKRRDICFERSLLSVLNALKWGSWVAQIKDSFCHIWV